MRSEKLHGFVLKRSNFGEADKILTVFSVEKGKAKLVAKGIRKIKSRRAPHLELFNLVELVIHNGKTFNIVTEAKTISTLKPDLKTTGYLFFVSEVLDKLLPEDQPHQEIYNSLVDILPTLSENTVKKFVVEILWELGYLPRGDYPKLGVSTFVESIIEKPLKSKKFLEEI